jgi:hypothetical protein
MAILGIGQGPLVGQAKEMLLEEASGKDRPLTRREAERMLREWQKRRKGR